MEVVEVRGSLVGQKRSLEAQREALTQVNFISADDIGKLPDQNAAEAVSRLPGVALERDRGEGRYVSIRGADPDLNSYTMDGMTLASPDDDQRTVLLDIYPSESMEQLKVSKAVTPDQPGDAIGGAIDIKSPGALDLGEARRLSLQGNYQDQSEEWDGHVDGLYGLLLGEAETVGLMLGFSSDRREILSQTVEASEWSQAQSPQTGDEIYMPGEIEAREYHIERERQGFTANLDAAPAEDTKLFLRGYYNEYIDQGIRYRSSVEMAEDGLVSLSDDALVVDVGDEEALGETRIGAEARYREETITNWGVNTGGENRFGALLADYSAGYSYAELNRDAELRARYRLDGVTRVGLQGLGDMPPSIHYPGPGVDVSDPANYSFRDMDYELAEIEEDQWEMVLNGRLDLADDGASYVKSGLRARLKDKQRETDLLESDANPDIFESMATLPPADLNDEFNFLVPNLDTVYRSLFGEMADEFAMERNVAAATVRDWESTEDVYAAYAMGGHTLGQLELLGGVRYEYTEFETRGYLFNNDTEESSRQRFDNDYGNVLPGIHARYSFTEDLMLRASYVHQLSRPQFAQTNAGVEIEDDEITRGNPDLKEATSRNFDVSLDYYLPEYFGAASVAVFYRDIEDFAFQRIAYEDIGGSTFQVNTFENGDSGYIQGIELAYRQQLNFLPAPFDGLGVYAAVTFADSEADLPPTLGRDDLEIPYPQQSDTTGNVELSYQRGGFEIRLAGTYRDDYIRDVGETADQDIIYRDHLQWDLSTRYTFLDHWTLFANMVNINEEPERYRFGESDRLAEYEEYGWTAQVGIKFTN